MSSGMTVSMAVILRPLLLGTGLGCGEMVALAAGAGGAVAGDFLADFFMGEFVRRLGEEVQSSKFKVQGNCQGPSSQRGKH